MDLTCWTDDPCNPRKRLGARTNELDDLLIAVGASRDGRAFTVLFDHFRPRVQAQLVRLGVAPVAAEDLTQDVMETIWRKAHLYDPRKSAATTWVQHIARNRRIDVTRRSREFVFAAFTPFPTPPRAATIASMPSGANTAYASRSMPCRANNSRLCGSPSSRSCPIAPLRDGSTCRSAR
ncbi:MAG: sigma factor [Xanthobacteraceae bacterium]